MKNRKVIYAVLTICLIFGTIVYAGTCNHWNHGSVGIGEPFATHEIAGETRHVSFGGPGGAYIMQVFPMEYLNDAMNNCQRKGQKDSK